MKHMVAFHHLSQSASKPQESGILIKDYITTTIAQDPLLTARSRGSTVSIVTMLQTGRSSGSPTLSLQRGPWSFLAVERPGRDVGRVTPYLLPRSIMSRDNLYFPQATTSRGEDQLYFLNLLYQQPAQPIPLTSERHITDGRESNESEGSLLVSHIQTIFHKCMQIYSTANDTRTYEYKNRKSETSCTKSTSFLLKLGLYLHNPSILTDALHKLQNLQTSINQFPYASLQYLGERCQDIPEQTAGCGGKYGTYRTLTYTLHEEPHTLYYACLVSL